MTGVEFSGARLPYVQAHKAFLVKANLARAKLQWADFSEADLRDANLADACLQHAIFEYADLRGAVLMGADLRGANLQGAIFEQTDLFDANVEKADFRFTLGLGKEDICEAKNWEKAVYDDIFFDDLKLKCPKPDQGKE